MVFREEYSQLLEHLNQSPLTENEQEFINCAKNNNYLLSTSLYNADPNIINCKD